MDPLVACFEALLTSVRSFRVYVLDGRHVLAALIHCLRGCKEKASLSSSMRRLSFRCRLYYSSRLAWPAWLGSCAENLFNLCPGTRAVLGQAQLEVTALERPLYWAVWAQFQELFFVDRSQGMEEAYVQDEGSPARFLD